MENQEALVAITQRELDQLEQEYIEYSQKAHTDLTHVSDYQAALRVPAGFLKKPSDFEQSFDKILFHLDEAYRKGGDENIRIMISRTTDELFHKVICIIQAKIDFVAKENAKGFFQKVGESISNFIENVRKKLDLDGPAQAILASAAPEVGKLTVAYFQYLLVKWQLGKEESYFYNQLADVYQKILNSRSFNNRFGLIRNTFTTNKDKIFSYVVRQKGLTAARNLMKFDEKDSEKQDSARIIIRTLNTMGQWEKGANLLHEIEIDRVANYAELKSEFISAYGQFLKSEAAREKPWKEIKVKYPTITSMEYLIAADNIGYDKYMRNRKIKKWSIVSLCIVFFILPIIFISPPSEKPVKASVSSATKSTHKTQSAAQVVLPQPAQSKNSVELSNLRREFAEADKEINAVYVQVMSNLSPGAKPELKKEEEAWVVEKRRKCKLDDDVQRLNCLIKMTRDRTAELNKYQSN